MKSKSYINYLIVVSAFVLAIYAYTILPEKVASHWNIYGEVDGYINRFWGAFLMPIISLILLVILELMPRFDPLYKNIKESKSHIDRFITVILLFFIYIYLLTLAWNINIEFNMSQLLAPALAGLWFQVGDIVGKVKKNWTIGIRTPWTLSNEKVWDRTHKKGEVVFKLLAFVTALGFLLPNYLFYLMFPVLFGGVLYLFVYSYLEYKKTIR